MVTAILIGVYVIGFAVTARMTAVYFYRIQADSIGMGLVVVTALTLALYWPIFLALFLLYHFVVRCLSRFLIPMHIRKDKDRK